MARYQGNVAFALDDDDILTEEHLRRFSTGYAHEEQQNQTQPEPQPQMTNFRFVTPQRFFAVIVITVLAVAMIYSQMQLTQITGQIDVLEANISSLQSEYISLKTRQDQMLSAEYVEAYAQEVLGMVKMDYSSVVYVELSNPDVVEIASANSATEFFGNIFS